MVLKAEQWSHQCSLEDERLGFGVELVAFAGVDRPTSLGDQCVDLIIGDARFPDVGWHYDEPTPAFQALTGRYAFYAQRLERCMVDDEVVVSNEGDFYGGWITANVTGPFKGAAGTMFW